MHELKSRYFFSIRYKGTAYHGWQKQKGVVSVQETIESALHKILQTNLHIVGCGRTDTGVHASRYFFHLDTDKTLKPDLLFVLNKELPDDISVNDIFPVSHNLHAQFSAKERSYCYYIHTTKDPFLSELSACYDLKGFDIKNVQEAARHLTGVHNFRAFCVTPARHSNTECVVKHALFAENKQEDGYTFQITADHFLRGMIRITVGKLIEIGLGRMTVSEFDHHLNSGERFKFLNQAYPQGLFLSDVKYP
ncbi:tRNA pseudouridine(38-40) synthase TruA [Saccharicrinis sp. FJH54]|uniref:tRNA pseudouridine(38-40) synthase TruA n=1 Tax=Saccharicrinis sp. FJH54 TaxID=3344665 RepID=UPI0035D4E1E1